MLTTAPWQHTAKTVKQVVECPRDDHIVVCREEKGDHDSSQACTYKTVKNGNYIRKKDYLLLKTY